MRSWVVAALCVVGCDAFNVAAAARRPAVAPSSRAPAARLFFGPFKKKSADELIGPVANPVGLSDEEISALKEAR